MKKPVRNIVVKTLLNADEFLKFDAACNDADITHSKALRDMANRFAHDRRRQQRGEWPAPVHNKAMFLPGRVNYGVAHTHMRM